MSNPTLRAMNAILDMLVAHDDSASEEVGLLALNTAFKALDEAGAITATFDDVTDQLDLDVTPLLTAVGATIETLVGLVALRTAQDRLTILGQVREHMNGVLED